MPDPASSAETIVDVADRLFTAIENGDMAAVDRLWSDDIAVWRVGARRDDDKARALRVIDWFITATTERRYEILDRQLFDADRQRLRPAAHPARHRPCRPIDLLRVCIVIRVGTRRPDRPDRRVLRPRRDRAAARLSLD